MGRVSAWLGVHLLLSGGHHSDPYIPGSFASPASSSSCKSTQHPVNRAVECEQEKFWGRGHGGGESDGHKRGLVAGRRAECGGRGSSPELWDASHLGLPPESVPSIVTGLVI